VPDVLHRLREAGVSAPLVLGGIIPPADAEGLLAAGVAAVYTPKDFELVKIMADLAELAAGVLETTG
jgi:(2R)-ethylmalonyl-CoA mutase